MGHENFLQPDPIEKAPTPEVVEESELTTEELDIKMHKAIEWYKHSFELWKAIEKGEDPTLPSDPEEAESYIDKFIYLKDHNQEKYRDKDGVEFYKRLDVFIEKLKEVK